ASRDSAPLTLVPVLVAGGELTQEVVQMHKLPRPGGQRPGRQFFAGFFAELGQVVEALEAAPGGPNEGVVFASAAGRGVHVRLRARPSRPRDRRKSAGTGARRVEGGRQGASDSTASSYQILHDRAPDW